MLRVKRRGDGLPFVVKVIPKEKIGMALTELRAFKVLGYHSRIIRLVEAFYDAQTRVHRTLLPAPCPVLSILLFAEILNLCITSPGIVLEPASMDLASYVTQLRGPGQAFLTSQARRMTAQLSSAVAVRLTRV